MVHVVQSSLIAVAMLCGVTTSTPPTTSTTWIAIAIVWHDSQLAYASAVFVLSTIPLKTAVTSKSTSSSDEPSCVLTADAVLSPPPSPCACAGAAKRERRDEGDEQPAQAPS